MIILTWISAFLLIQTSQSYVLLTANLDDVQNLVQQVMQSSAAEKVGQYVRRAATLFNQHLRSRAGDEKDLKESPIVRQVVNVLRSAYTLIKDQFNVVEKDSDAQAVRKTPDVDSTVESSAEDVTRRRARYRMHHSGHRHNRQHYPETHKARYRRTDAAADSWTDQKADTIAKNNGGGTPIASEERREKLKETNEMLALGKNASRYLDTIKEIIQKSTV